MSKTANSTNATTAKYRPVLTASQITKVLELAKTECPISDLSFSLISTLAPFQAKIEADGIQPAYIPAPVRPSATSLEALGGEIPSIPSPSPTAPKEIKEVVWQHSYFKYMDDPVSCSLQEIQEANEWKYLNDLMTPEELRLFEANSGIEE